MVLSILAKAQFDFYYLYEWAKAQSNSWLH